MSDKWMGAVTPERAGVPSGAVTAFIKRINKRGIRLHSFMLLRDNQIAAEAYWKPFCARRNHRAYSISKSFTAAAIGLLRERGKLSLDDRVADLLPDKVPADAHEYVRQATVRDLLRMATPHEATTYKLMDGDWVGSFFKYPPSHPPGTIFSYDTSGTHVLGAVVERVSGLPILEYLRREALDEIGFSKGAIWLPDPYGVSNAGSGLCCTTRDLALFGLLCMNYGNYEGKQLLPEAYMREAAAKQIGTSIGNVQLNSYVAKGLGYGYQIWCGPEDSFICYGMAGQFIFAHPGRGLMAVTTADVQIDPGCEAYIVDAIWEEIFENAAKTALPEDQRAKSELDALTAGLGLLLPEGEKNSPVARKVSGGRWKLGENKMGIAEIGVELTADSGALEYLKVNGNHRIEFGMGSWTEQNFSDGGYDCAAAGMWADENTLEIWACMIDETPATLKFLLHFDGDAVSVKIHRAVDTILFDYTGFAGGKRL